MRAGGRGLLPLGDLGAQSRPHRGLLELDVLPGGPDELAEQLFELRVADVELGQYFSSLASTSLASCSWPVAWSASVSPSGR